MQASGEITAEKWSWRDQEKEALSLANSVMIAWPVFLVLMEVRCREW